MSLAQRLLLALAILTVATTGALGWGVRSAWRAVEEERFEARSRQAADGLRAALAGEAQRLDREAGPLCRHDPVVDAALTDLRAGRFDHGRQLAISLQTPELRKARGLDELILIDGSGRVLGASATHEERVAGWVGTRTESFAKAAREAPTEGPRTSLERSADRGLSLRTACARADGGQRVAVVAARHLDALLGSLETSDIRLTLARPPADDAWHVAGLRLDDWGGLEVWVAQSRTPLDEALRRLDWTVAALGAGVLLVGWLLAIFLARSVAAPVTSLALQARRAVHDGEVSPVRARGAREVVELADAFNQAAQDLVRLRRRLAATERAAAQRQVADRVAHEIKNPLLPIRASVETLRRLRDRRDPRFDEVFDDATRTVLDEVARINAIVVEFTRFARMPPPRPADVDLAEELARVVRAHAGTGADVRFVARARPRARVDRDQLVQVVTNLVQNAVDAVRAAPGGGVAVELDADAARARIFVADDGAGVPEELRDRIFDPYVTGKEGGTGLGLAIVQRIVADHGGEVRLAAPGAERAPVTCTGAPARGACFVVDLPLAGPDGGPPSAGSAPPPVLGAAPPAP